MNEVESVFDACVAEPPQLDIDADIFKAWTQGIKVPELVSTLKSSLLSEYELDASASGSGYGTLALTHTADESSSEDDESIAADEEILQSTPRPKFKRPSSIDRSEDGFSADLNAAAASNNPDPMTPRTKPKTADSQPSPGPPLDEMDLAVQEQLRRSAEIGSISSSEDDLEKKARLKGRGSRRNSTTVSVSAKQGNLQSSPQLRSTHSPGAPREKDDRFIDPLVPRRHSGPPIPQPSAIDLVCSNQAQARLLWVWENQLEYQYRLFTLLEPSLKKPFLLNIHYCIFQLSFQMQLQLTNLYYDFDPAFMRHLMGQKLSTKTRGSVEGILDRVKDDRLMELSRLKNFNSSQAVAQHGRRNSQSQLDEVQLAAAAAAAASSSATGMTPAQLLSLEAIRISSAYRQFDNLRRIYRSRWGEKGDGVIGESAVFDLEVQGIGAGVFPSQSTNRERWKSMRNAAVAAMAKRGFRSTSDKNATQTNTAATNTANRSALLNRLDAQNSDRGGLGLGGGLDEFFGFDASSQPIRSAEQTAPLFFQQQFRLHSALARQYARLVFLAHYRFEASTKRKKQENILSFQEVELIAQILMRCWTLPVGAGANEINAAQLRAEMDASTDAAVSPLSLSLAPAAGVSSTPALLASGAPTSIASQLPSQLSLVVPASPHAAAGGNNNSSNLPDTVHQGSISTLTGTSKEAMAAHTINQSMFQPPIARLISAESSVVTGRRASLDEGSIEDITTPPSQSHNLSTLHPTTATSLPASAITGAAASGYDFLPIVSSMKEADEDTWVGDTLDMEFIDGLKELKTHFSSRLLEEYAAALSKLCRETASAQLNSALLMVAPVATPSSAAQTINRTLANAATAQPRLQHQASASNTTSVSPNPIAVSSLYDATVHPPAHLSTSMLRASMLQRLPSKLLPWLKDLFSLATSLMKSKRIRSLLPDLQEDVLKPLHKLGCNASEVAFLLRAVREIISELPSVKKYQIVKEPQYPFAYEKKARAAAATTAASKDEESKNGVNKVSVNSMSSASSSPSPSISSIAAGASSPSSSFAPADPVHRVLIHWCRFLDAVAPISIILFMKLSRNESS